MINLEPYREAFRYRTADRGEVIEVKIHYSLGDWRRPRGIYIRFVPMTLHADGHSSYMASSITQKLLLPLDRKSPKKLVLIAEELDREIPQMAADFKAFRGTPLQRAEDLVKALFPAKAEEVGNGTA